MNRRRINALCALSLLWITSCPAEEFKLVAFGDSTTAFRGTIEQVYSVRLPKLLEKFGIQAVVVNEAVGGSNTSRVGKHALARISKVRAHQADWVIVQFGINDCWIDGGVEGGKSRVSLADYKKNLTEMVQTLREDRTRVLLMTPNQLRSDVAPWRVDRLEEYVRAVRQVAAEQTVPLVDIWDAYDELSASERDALLLDGVHPNDAGQALVAEKIVARLKPMLADHAPAK
jgi:lysophospholipase L1-like esterase